MPALSFGGEMSEVTVKIRRTVDPGKQRVFRSSVSNRKPQKSPADDGNVSLKINPSRDNMVWVVGLKNTMFEGTFISKGNLRKVDVNVAIAAIKAGRARHVKDDEAKQIVESKLSKAAERKVDAPKVKVVRRSNDHGGEIKPVDSWDPAVTGFETPEEYLQDKRRTKYKALAESLIG